MKKGFLVALTILSAAFLLNACGGGGNNNNNNNPAPGYGTNGNCPAGMVPIGTAGYTGAGYPSTYSYANGTPTGYGAYPSYGNYPGYGSYPGYGYGYGYSYSYGTYGYMGNNGVYPGYGSTYGSPYGSPYGSAYGAPYGSQFGYGANPNNYNNGYGANSAYPGCTYANGTTAYGAVGATCAAQTMCGGGMVHYQNGCYPACGTCMANVNGSCLPGM